MIEITVTIKGDESTYKQKYLCYEEFIFSESDPYVQALVKQALDSSKIEPVDIKVRALIQYQ